MEISPLSPKSRPANRPTPKTPLPLEEQKSLLLGILNEFLPDPDELFDYFDHVGFDPLCLGRVRDLPQAWVAYYRVRAGVYDVDRACRDLATWPPIAARIAYLQAQKLDRSQV